MNFDLFLAGVVLMFGLFGLFSGAINQLRHWIGLIAAALAVRPLSAFLMPHVAPWIKLSPGLAVIILSSLVFIVIYTFAAAAADRLMQELFPNRRQGRADGLFGFALGAAKGTALLFAALSFLVFYEKPLTRKYGPPPAVLQDSRAVAYARRHDLFGAVPAPPLTEVEKLIDTAKDPRALHDLEKSPEVRRLLDDPRLKSALQNASPR